MPSNSGPSPQRGQRQRKPAENGEGVDPFKSDAPFDRDQCPPGLGPAPHQ
jgi:hypothetical protein